MTYVVSVKALSKPQAHLAGLVVLLAPSHTHPCPPAPAAILLVLLPKAIWALLETPCFAQLPAQLFLICLLHGFNG